MNTTPTNPDHEILYQDLTKLLSKHAHKVSAAELLAIAANMVGKIIAMQDSRTMSKDRALEIVARNLELGNLQVIEIISNTKGSA